MALVRRYFVIKPEGNNPYAYAARKAMLAFAEAIKDKDPTMCRQLKLWVKRETPVRDMR